MLPTNGRTGVCEICKCEAQLTWDHVVPKWVLTDVSRFGVDNQAIIEKANLTGKMWRNVCAPCNLAKGGNIIYEDPIVRAYLRAFVLAVYERMQAYSGPRKVAVVCGCNRKEPCSTVPGAMPSPIKTATIPHSHWEGKCWCGNVAGVVHR